MVLSSVALNELMLERIVACDGKLHSHAALVPDALLAAACVAGAEVAAGNWRGPLYGRPLAVKDAFAIVNIPTGFVQSRLCGAGDR